MRRYWLIEAPNPRGWAEYIERIDTFGTYDIYMTRDSVKAMKFISRAEAQMILDDTAFVHAMGTNKGFYVAEHADMEGPEGEEKHEDRRR